MEETKINEINKELLSALKEVFDLTEGAWDDPVISEQLYNKMQTAIKQAETNKS